MAIKIRILRLAYLDWLDSEQATTTTIGFIFSSGADARKIPSVYGNRDKHTVEDHRMGNRNRIGRGLLHDNEPASVFDHIYLCCVQQLPVFGVRSIYVLYIMETARGPRLSSC